MSESASNGGAAPAAESAAPVESAQSNSTPNPSGAQASGDISSSQEAEIQEALESGDTKEAQKLIKKYQLKIKGQVRDVEVDLSDDDFIRNQLQLAEVSKRSMQESAELKKAYQKELERFRQNPWEVMQELGLDPDEVAEMRIQQRIEEMKKSPEQLEKEKYMRELEEARAESKRLKEEKEQIEMQKLQEQAAVQINDEITRALSGHKTLPNSPYVIKRVADSMLWAMNNGFEDVTAEDVVPLVEQEMRAEMSQLYDQMPEELLEQFIGKKNIERMRKKRVSQVKAPPSVNDIKQTALASKAAEAARPKEQKRVYSKDFFKQLGKNK